MSIETPVFPLSMLIRDRRRELGQSLRQTATLANISHSELSRIEDDFRRHPSPKILRGLSTALNIRYIIILMAAGYLNAKDLV